MVLLDVRVRTPLGLRRERGRSRGVCCLGLRTAPGGGRAPRSQPLPCPLHPCRISCVSPAARPPPPPPHPLQEPRTKRIAALRGMVRFQAMDLGQDPDEAESKLGASWYAAMAEVLKHGDVMTQPTGTDRRFPNKNQAISCWTAFNEYQLCVDKLGNTDKKCLQRGRDCEWGRGWVVGGGRAPPIPVRALTPPTHPQT